MDWISRCRSAALSEVEVFAPATCAISRLILIGNFDRYTLRYRGRYFGGCRSKLLQRLSPLQSRQRLRVLLSHHESGVCESGIWHLKRESGIWNLRITIVYWLDSLVIPANSLNHFIHSLKSIVKRQAQTCISDRFCNGKRPGCIFQESVCLL